MKFLVILIFFPFLATADEFDWSVVGLKISEVEISTESGSVLVVVGSYCYASNQCDIAAKFLLAGEEVEFVREVADDKATVSLVENNIVIAMTYYPRGQNKIIQIQTRFVWNKDEKRFKQIHQEHREYQEKVE
jgi:hypothetical protein